MGWEDYTHLGLVRCSKSLGHPHLKRTEKSAMRIHKLAWKVCAIVGLGTHVKYFQS